MAAWSGGRRAIWLGHVGVLALFVLLTAVMTWPMVAHFGDAVLGPPGDNLEYVWKMWWLKNALLERKVSPFFVPEVFYPFGYPLALSETTLANTLLGLPIAAIWGEVAGYNAMVYFSFVLSGYAVYLLLSELDCGPFGAFIGGLVFAFSPYRLAHLGAGHLPLMGTGWIALSFLALERLIRRPSWGRGALLGAAFALTALSSWYYVLIVAPLLALYLLLRTWTTKARKAESRKARNPETLWRRELWLGLGVGGVLCGLLVAPAAVPLLKLYLAGEMGGGYSLGYTDRWSASPLDFVYPNAMHPWWGAALTTGYYQNVNEHLLYLGLAGLLLAGIGLWSRWRERPARALAIVGIVAFVLALGTTLHWGGQAVHLPVPEALEYQFSRAMYVLTGKLALHKVDYSPLRAEGAIPLPLPALLLYLFVPAIGVMRVWARFGVLTVLAVSVLAGWGAHWVVEHVGKYSPKRRLLLGAGMAFLVLLDLAAWPYAYGYTEAGRQPLDDWLASRATPAPIIYYPLEKTWYGWMLYPMRFHGQPIAYGYGTFAPKAYREGIKAVQDWPSESALGTLRRWGIQYVLMGARSYGERWAAVREAVEGLPGVREVAVFEDQPIFHGDRLFRLLRPSADVPATELISGERRGYLQDEVHIYAIQ